MNNSYFESDVYKYFLESPEPTIKHTSYFQVYDEIFAKFRNKMITFVEIGVLNGGSLFMWRNYFGKEARIIGIDLNPEAKKWELHGFEIFIGNQGSKKFWENTLQSIGKIDVLLDDGGHTYKQQIVTVESVLNSINDNGVIVVEDVQTSYLKGFGPRRYSFVKYTNALIDRINARSGELVKIKHKKTIIWSIQTFESIVVFHINRLKSSVNSIRIENKSNKLRTIDYRYLDNHFFKSSRIFGIHTRKYSYVFKIAGYKILRIVSYIDAVKSRYYKYFK
jgi:hypothetical protein